MAKFVRCSVPEITYQGGAKITNNAVNIDLCTVMRLSTYYRAEINEHAWYPDTTGKPSIKFDGCDAEWVYNNEADRDADYQRIVTDSK